MLTSELDPVFFRMTCLLMLSLLFTTKIMTDQLDTAQDQGLDFFSIPNLNMWFRSGLAHGEFNQSPFLGQ